MKHAEKKKSILITATAIMLLLTVLSAVKGVAFLFALVLLIWVGQVAFAVCDIKNRTGYLVFLLAFFLFLLGGEFFELYFGYKQEFTFIDEWDRHAYICLLISLLALQVGFFAANYVIGRNAREESQKNSHDLQWVSRMRRITLAGMGITVVPWFVTALEAGIYSLQHGYLSYYTNFHSQLPEVLESLSDLFPLFFFFFLATLPSQKETYIALLVYILHGCIILLIGRRIMFGVALLVSLFYVVYRHYSSSGEKWISKKFVILVLTACPVIIAGLYVQRFVRYGQAVEENSGLLDMICRFLSQQGSGIHPIKLQKEIEGDTLGCTSLYYTLHFLRGNLLTRGFFDFPMEYYTQRTVETATQTNCLADYIMYKVNAEDFFAGYGLGTSYIAELHHDLGYLGVAMGSLIYGALLRWLYAGQGFTIWKFGCGLLMLEEFVILPRYGADVIFRPFYNLTRLLVLGLMVVLMWYTKETLQRHRKL